MRSAVSGVDLRFAGDGRGTPPPLVFATAGPFASATARPPLTALGIAAATADFAIEPASAATGDELGVALADTGAIEPAAAKCMLAAGATLLATRGATLGAAAGGTLEADALGELETRFAPFTGNTSGASAGA